jgi:hypothetical protein
MVAQYPKTNHYRGSIQYLIDQYRFGTEPDLIQRFPDGIQNPLLPLPKN